jgi:tRNA-specific adenosine deaminase 1
MELCMASQEDATPWEVLRHPKPATESQEPDASDAEILLDGRAHFSLLGVVRRKPARTDAESTRSKSCSDKLALKQVSSLLSCETSRLVAPTENAYIAGLVLPEDEITQVGFDRCFGAEGRMQALVGRSWPVTTETDNTTPRYRFRPFNVLSVPSEEVAALWPFFKPKPITTPTISSEPENDSSTSTVSPKKCKPGNASAVWTLAPSHQHSSPAIMDTGSKNLPHLARSKTGLYETVINGVKQGNRASSPGKRGASALSRAKLWALFHDINHILPPHPDRNGASVTEALDTVETGGLPAGTSQRTSLGVTVYRDMKQPIDFKDPLHIRMQAIRDAKQVLKGWMPNSGDENWGLDVLVDQKKRKRDIPKALE